MKKVRQKDRYHLISLICGNTEQRVVLVARGRGFREMDEGGQRVHTLLLLFSIEGCNQENFFSHLYNYNRHFQKYFQVKMPL